VEPNIDVIGVAETGAYREEKHFGAILEKIAGPKHEHYPDAKHFGLTINDNAMDQFSKMPLIHGAKCAFVNVDDAGIQIEPNRVYALQRRLNGTSLIETLVRRLVIDNGARLLRADTSQPERFPDIAVGRLTTDKSKDVFVIGLLYWVGAHIRY